MQSVLEMCHVQSTQQENAGESELLRSLNLEVPQHRHGQDEERNIGNDVRARGDNQEHRQVDAAPLRFPGVFRPVVRGWATLESGGEEGADSP